MKMMMRALLAAMTLTVAMPAAAVTTSYTFSGTASNNSIFSGSYSLDNDYGTYALTAFSGSFEGNQYDLNNSGINIVGSRILLGGNISGVNSTASGTNDFYFGYFVPSNNNVEIYGSITTSSSTRNYDVLVKINPVAIGTPSNGSALPEPATWAMTILGFGAIGSALRRQRMTTVRLAGAA